MTGSGRVVLLDFGLVQDLAAPSSNAPEEGEIAGTVAYMAPEQAAGKALSPAGDWYAVGVMLFQALTGRLPFESQGLRLLADKQRFDSPAISSLAPTAPPDLAELCQKLLHRTPGARPSGVQVRDLLRGLAPEPVSRQPERETNDPAVFVGRHAQLAELRGAAELGRSKTVVVYVHGRSGVGKSWLMQHFLDDLAAHDKNVVLLAGRCYERESVPYKALDGLMDALSRYLCRRPTEETSLLLSPDVPLLARLFPVLRRVSAIASTGIGPDVADPHELRRRAFVGLRNLLARLGNSRRLILYIDDLQWGDLDSAALLTELLAPPAAPRLSLFCSYRREYQASSACLRALLESSNANQMACARRDLPIEPLDLTEAEQLTRALLKGSDSPALRSEVQSIARESEGGPYFIRELVHYLRQGRRQAGSRESKITLDQVLWERVCALPGPAQRLLEIVAVAGKPMRQRTRSVPEPPSWGRRHRCFASPACRPSDSQHGAPGALDEVEIYHDRIREVVNHHLTARALAECHGLLAKVQEEAGHADSETLAIHFLGSGDREKAAHYYRLAAARAAGALAFERAVRLYRQALSTWPLQGAAARDVYAGLAKSLADAGRAPEAGDAYCAAAQEADGDRALELRVEAARHYLMSGHVERGLEELRPALQAVGLRYPRLKIQSLFSLVWRSVWLRRHSLRFQARADISPSELLRLDVCIMAAGSLGYYTISRSLDFSLRAAQMALATGEPGRVVEALAVLAMVESAGGGASRHRTHRLIEAAQAACNIKPTPYLHGVMDCIRGHSAYLCGEYRDGLHYSTRAGRRVFGNAAQAGCTTWHFSRARISSSRTFSWETWPNWPAWRRRWSLTPRSVAMSVSWPCIARLFCRFSIWRATIRNGPKQWSNRLWSTGAAANRLSFKRWRFWAASTQPFMPGASSEAWKSVGDRLAELGSNRPTCLPKVRESNCTSCAGEPRWRGMRWLPASLSGGQRSALPESSNGNGCRAVCRKPACFGLAWRVSKAGPPKPSSAWSAPAPSSIAKPCAYMPSRRVGSWAGFSRTIEATP